MNAFDCNRVIFGLLTVRTPYAQPNVLVICVLHLKQEPCKLLVLLRKFPHKVFGDQISSMASRLLRLSGILRGISGVSNIG